MELTGILGVFCGIAVFAGMSSAIQLLNKKGDLSALILGFLFIAISLRVAKSIWYFILYDVADFGLALGFLGLAATGPLLWLYYKRAKAENQMHRLDYLHLLIPFAGFFLVLFSSIELVTGMYKTATALLLIYALYTTFIAFRRPVSDLKKLSLGVLIVGLSFVFQHLSETMAAYAIGAALAALILVYLSRQQLLPQKSRKIVHSIPQDVLDKVRLAFEQQKVFQQADLSINTMASNIAIPAYQISKSVKVLYGKTFPETLMFFRVKEAQLCLVSGNGFLKVENVAFQVGFKSASAYYAAFKKVTGKSPKEYRKDILSSGLKSTTVELTAS